MFNPCRGTFQVCDDPTALPFGPRPWSYNKIPHFFRLKPLHTKLPPRAYSTMRMDTTANKKSATIGQVMLTAC